MPTENTMKPFWDRTSTKILSGVALICFVVLIWAGIPEYEKAQADTLVRELCAKDGGMHVYEVVKLPASRFESHGLVTFPGPRLLPRSERYMKPDDEFFSTYDRTTIVPAAGFHPEVWRNHHKLFRTADRKLLGEGISYARRGGDPIGPWHPSSFLCPSNADIVNIVRQVFAPQ